MKITEKDNEVYGYISYLLDNAILQDTLLQSYRGLYLTLQSIFLAIATGLFVAVLTTDGFTPIFLFVVQCVISVFGLVSQQKLKGVLTNRGNDVYWWHEKILRSEKLISKDLREFYKFKCWQRGITPIKDYSDDDIEILINRETGNTRKVIENLLSN